MREWVDGCSSVLGKACGSTPFILQVSVSEAVRARAVVRSSGPANKAFLAVSFSDRMSAASPTVSRTRAP